MKLLDFYKIESLAGLQTPEMWYEWVNDALENKKRFIMPAKQRISQEGGNYFNIMPVMDQERQMALVKMIGRHNLKPGEHRPTMMGDLMLYDAQTGRLLAVMDAEYITTLRTGAVAAHSALLFSNECLSTITLIGLGNIMKVFFKTFISIMRKKGRLNKPLTVKLKRYHNHEVTFAKTFQDTPNVRFVYCDTYEESISDSDMIVSAVTQASGNFASDSCYKQGTTVIPICTMGFQNCDLFFDKVFTDEIEQIRGFKYFNKFHELLNVSDVLNGVSAGRESNFERILVYNYGIAIHDIYFAEKFYDIAEDSDVKYDFCKESQFIRFL